MVLTLLLPGHIWLFGARTMPRSWICLVDGYLVLMLSTTRESCISQAASVVRVMLYEMKSTRSGAVALLAQGDATGAFQNASVGLAHRSVNVLCSHLISHLAVPTAVSNPASNHWLVWKQP